MRLIEAAVETDYGIDLGGWQLSGPLDFSTDGRTLVGVGVNPAGELQGWILELPTRVGIHVLPGQSAARLRGERTGRHRIAVLGATNLDVRDVDAASLAFGPGGAAPVQPVTSALRDVDGDGRTDRVFHFDSSEAGIEPSDIAACMHGATLDGEEIFGCGALRSGVSIFEEIGYLRTPGPAFDVEVRGALAYVAAHTSGGLRIADVADPRAPVEIGALPIAANDVALSGNHAFVAALQDGLSIVDVSDPSSPIERSRLPAAPGDLARRVVVRNGLAYVSIAKPEDPGFRLQIVDVSEPTHPVETGSLDLPGGPAGNHVDAGLVYVAARAAGVRIVAASDPSAPIEIGAFQTPSRALAVAVRGRHAYVAEADGLRILDVSDPREPRQVGFAATGAVASHVDVKGELAYVTVRSKLAEPPRDDGLRVFDVRNPTLPVLVGSARTPDLAFRVAVDGQFAYVADFLSGLRIIGHRGEGND